MSTKELIRLVYIDDDREEGISKYLNTHYRNDAYDVRYDEVEFKGSEGYEKLLEMPDVTAANVILIDSRLFENDYERSAGRFTGEEFRMILRKVLPFIEVLVISQNGENKDFDIIPKYRYTSAESEVQHYERVLKQKIDESIERVAIFRNISKKLEHNEGIEKLLVERIVSALNGINEYDGLSKADVDRLIEAFQNIGQG